MTTPSKADIDWLIQVLRETDPGPSPPRQHIPVRLGPPQYIPWHDNDVWVSLEEAEVWEAMEAGKAKRKDSLSSQDHEKVTIGIGEEGRSRGDIGEWLNIIGEIGERGTAKALSLPWTPTSRGYKEADLPHNVEVKLIGKESYGMRVYQHIPDTRRVVGIVIPKGKEFGPYRIPGWMYAGDAKQERLKMRPYDKGLYFYAVPQNELRPLGELIAIIQSERVGGHS